MAFLSTLSLRRATTLPKDQRRACLHFYPRSPCGERPERCRMLDLFIVFLSTLSLRRATYKRCEFGRDNRNFYPRSPCGERPSSVKVSLSGSTISIHALLAESDQRPCGRPTTKTLFLSTLSLRRATGQDLINGISLVFLSTLSLRRATLDAWESHYVRGNFYPRSPCGERRH